MRFIYLFGLICLGAVLIEGCIKKKTPGLLRSKRSTAKAVGDDDEMKLCRSELKTCMNTAGVTDFAGVIDFQLLHSDWGKAALVACDTTKNTVDCWKGEVNKIIPVATTIHSKLTTCIDEYDAKFTSKRVRREASPAEESPTKVRSTRDVSKMVSCPKTTEADFITEVEKMNAAGVTLKYAATDDSLKKMDEVVKHYKTLIRCPDCTCANMKAILAADSPPITTMTAESGCADCWYTKLADATQKTSVLAMGFAKAALAMTEKTHIVCSPNPRILISAADLTKMNGAKATDLFLGHVKKCSKNAKAIEDPSTVTECIGKVHKTAGGDGASFSVGVDKCSLAEERKIDGKNMVLTYTVSNMPAKVDANTHIERFSCMTKVFTCTIPMTQAMVSPKVVPEVKTDVADAVSGESKYDLDFTVKADTVKVSEYVEAEIKIKNVAIPADFQLTARNCYASPLATFEASPVLQYKLTTCHGCMEGGYATDDVVVANNGKKSAVSFKFKAFTWNKAATAKQIFIHCSVSVCDSKAVACPAATDCAAKADARGDCPSLLMRYRRNIRVTDERRASIGPITVTDNEVESTVYPTKFFTSM